MWSAERQKNGLGTFKRSAVFSLLFAPLFYNRFFVCFCEHICRLFGASFIILFVLFSRMDYMAPPFAFLPHIACPSLSPPYTPLPSSARFAPKTFLTALPLWPHIVIRSILYAKKVDEHYNFVEWFANDFLQQTCAHAKLDEKKNAGTERRRKKMRLLLWQSVSDRRQTEKKKYNFTNGVLERSGKEKESGFF